MGQVLSNFIRSVFGKAEEEERPSEQQNLLISPAISDSCIDPYIESSTHGVVIDIDSSIQVVEDNRQVIGSVEPVSIEYYATVSRESNILFFGRKNPTYPTREEEQAKEDDNEEEKRRNEVERWRQHCSSSHIIQVLEDNWQVSQPFPYLNAREPIREEDQAKEGKKKRRHRARGSCQYRVGGGQDICNLTPVSTEDVSATQTHDHQVAWEPYHFAKVHPKDLSTREPREEHQAKVEDNEEEKRSNEVERWIQHYTGSHIIPVVEDNRQVSPPLPDLNTREPIREEDQANVEDNEEEKRRNEVERWIQHCSSSHIIQVVEDNRQVSPPFPDLNTREPIREEDQAKEGNDEEKRSNELERCIQHCSSSHIIQVVEDNWQVSPPFPDLNTREPIREEEQAKEEKKKRHRARGSRQCRVWGGQDVCNLTPVSRVAVSANQTRDHQLAWDKPYCCAEAPEGNEEEKLIISKVSVNKKKSKHKKVVAKERWIEYYSSSHKTLLVGDGDFSFSASLAMAFGSATNMVATSLDSTDVLITKYKEAKSNLENLEKLGACLLHGVDATKMKLHSDLQMRKFDRIIYNFPHAGFHGKEDDVRIIEMHKKLVHGFFENARGMLSANGEVHVNHKTTAPFCRWNLEDLASRNSLALIKCVDFKRENYPGYNNKRGAGSRCDEPFPLGECSTFKFRFSPTARKMYRAKKYRLSLTRRSQQPLGKFCSRSTEGWV